MWCIVLQTNNSYFSVSFHLFTTSRVLSDHLTPVRDWAKRSIVCNFGEVVYFFSADNVMPSLWSLSLKGFDFWFLSPQDERMKINTSILQSIFNFLLSYLIQHFNSISILRGRLACMNLNYTHPTQHSLWYVNPSRFLFCLTISMRPPQSQKHYSFQVLHFNFLICQV